MNTYEMQREVFARRIKKIEESPDPRHLRSNKMLYELEKELVESQLDAWQRGEPFAEGPRLERLLTSMGFQCAWFVQAADRSPYSRYKRVIEGMGFPEQCCDRTVTMLAMMEIGDVPKPHVMVNPTYGCDAVKLVYDSMARRHNIPMFYIDYSLNPEEPNLDSLNYIADQLGECVEWLEKTVPGIKYDEDRLREIQETDAIGLNYMREIYQLRKHVPCPIAPMDAFRIVREPRRYPNMQKANEYLRIHRDELGERVASGSGPYPEERLRLLWAASGPYLLDPWRMLLERKVAVPMLKEGGDIAYMALQKRPYGEVSEYGVKLAPLQEEAREMDRMSWGGPGKRWVTDTLDGARDLGVQGIVHYLQMGCTPILSSGSVLADRAEKELGIPVLNVEGRQMDPDYTTQAQFIEILSSFIDKCFDWAGKPRQ